MSEKNTPSNSSEGNKKPAATPPDLSAKPANPTNSGKNAQKPASKPESVPDNKNTPAKAAVKTPPTVEKTEKVPEIKSSSSDKTPPPAPPTPPPAAIPAKKGSGLTLLALLIGVAGLGMGGYSYQQVLALKQQSGAGSSAEIQQLQTTTDTLQQSVDSLQSQLGTLKPENLNQTLSALQSKIANAAQGLDKAQVSQMIAQGLASVKPASGISADQVEALINQKLSQLPETGVSADQVKTMLTEALANFAQGNEAPKLDFSKEIEAIRQSEAQAQSALAALNQRAKEVQASLSEQASALGGQISSQASAPMSGTLISTLELANIAGQSGNYQSAARYLDLALNNFANWHLQGSAFANYQTQIQSARDQFDAASQNNPAAQLSQVIASLDQWPLQSGNTKNEVSSDPQATDTSFTSQAKEVGNSILQKAFTVTKDDEAGLTWINADPTLQNIVRENIRLDIAYARNAALLHDNAQVDATLTQLKTQISRYFDSSDAQVAAALSTIENLSLATPELPDLNGLIAAVKQTAGE